MSSHSAPAAGSPWGTESLDVVPESEMIPESPLAGAPVVDAVGTTPSTGACAPSPLRDATNDAAVPAASRHRRRRLARLRAFAWDARAAEPPSGCALAVPDVTVKRARRRSSDSRRARLPTQARAAKDPRASWKMFFSIRPHRRHRGPTLGRRGPRRGVRDDGDDDHLPPRVTRERRSAGEGSPLRVGSRREFGRPPIRRKRTPATPASTPPTPKRTSPTLTRTVAIRASMIGATWFFLMLSGKSASGSIERSVAREAAFVAHDTDGSVRSTLPC